MPLAPCLAHSPRACALVVHPACLHFVLVTPPCLTQSPLTLALVIQSTSEQTPYAPWCLHNPRELALLVHPTCVHGPLPPCFLHSTSGPSELVLHPVMEHTP
jgi:hypothetical protein